jgi:hypothetical protein
MAESINEEKAPPEEKKRKRCCRRGMATTTAVGMGQDAATAVGMGQGTKATVGMGNGISALLWQAMAPRPRSRAVERTLSFHLDNGGSMIRLEKLLDCWADTAAHEHDHQDNWTPCSENFRF